MKTGFYFAAAGWLRLQPPKATTGLPPWDTDLRFELGRRKGVGVGRPNPLRLSLLKPGQRDNSPSPRPSLGPDPGRRCRVLRRLTRKPTSARSGRPPGGSSAA